LPQPAKTTPVVDQEARDKADGAIGIGTAAHNLAARLDGDFTGLDASFGDLAGDFDALQARLARLRPGVSRNELNQRVAALNGQMSALNTRIRQNTPGDPLYHDQPFGGAAAQATARGWLNDNGYLTTGRGDARYALKGELAGLQTQVNALDAKVQQMLQRQQMQGLIILVAAVFALVVVGIAAITIFR
jgi:hypothetical protein